MLNFFPMGVATRSKDFLFLLALPCCAHAADFSSEATKVSELAEAAAKQGRPLFPVDKTETVSVSFVKIGTDPWRMGLLQKVRVNAPFENLVRVIDDTAAYVGLFQDLKESSKRDVAGPDDYTLFTETSIPVPFVPNDRTSMRYHVSHGTGFALYRFHLVEGNHLNAYDGVALAAADGERQSVYWELDLLEPSFGMARALPVKKFWVQNAVSSAQSDWAYKLRAENATVKSQAILDDSVKRSEALEVKIGAAYDAAAAFADLLAQATPTSPSTNASAKKPRAPAPSTAKPKASGPKSEPKP
jgi:hypothetical protein